MCTYPLLFVILLVHHVSAFPDLGGPIFLQTDIGSELEMPTNLHEAMKLVRLMKILHLEVDYLAAASAMVGHCNSSCKR